MTASQLYPPIRTEADFERAITGAKACHDLGGVLVEIMSAARDAAVADPALEPALTVFCMGVVELTERLFDTYDARHAALVDYGNRIKLGLVDAPENVVPFVARRA